MCHPQIMQVQSYWGREGLGWVWMQAMVLVGKKTGEGGWYQPCHALMSRLLSCQTTNAAH